MGWSGKGILDGDSTMDAAAFIAHICGCPKDYDGSSNDFLTKENLEKHQAAILAKFKKKKVNIISVQTFAAYMVEVGAIFNEFPIEDCIRCLKEDDWAKQDIERKYHIDYLLNILENYNNEPTSYYDKNLDYDYKVGKTSKYATYILEIFKKTDYFKNDINISAKVGYMFYEYCLVVLFKDDSSPELIQYSKNCMSNFFDLKIVYVSSNDFILNPNPNE